MKKATRIKIVALALVIITLLGMCTVGAETSNTDTSISIPEGKQAVYTLKVNRATAADKATITDGTLWLI